MKTSESYLEVDIERGSGIVNYRTGKVIGFNCDIEFNCSCGWHGYSFGEHSKGKTSKICPDCGAKSSYEI